jgi:hypothetical protein
LTRSNRHIINKLAKLQTFQRSSVLDVRANTEVCLVPLRIPPTALPFVADAILLDDEAGADDTSWELLMIDSTPSKSGDPLL